MARSGRERGGTIVNIITALVFFGLLGYGIMWLIKGFGEAGEQYSGAMVQAKLDATSVTCQSNLRTIGQNLQMYAISNGTFPESLEELIEFSGNTRLFECPSPEGGQTELLTPEKLQQALTQTQANFGR